jgi:hypothetical protein
MKLARYHTINWSMLHTIKSKLAKDHTLILKTKLEYDTKNYSMLNKIRICYNFVLIDKRRSLNILSYSNLVSSYSNSFPSYYKILFG